MRTSWSVGLLLRRDQIDSGFCVVSRGLGRLCACVCDASEIVHTCVHVCMQRHKMSCLCLCLWSLDVNLHYHHCFSIVLYVYMHICICVFINTGARDGDAWVSLSSSCWPESPLSAGRRRSNQWPHQEASCDSKFLIQFLLTLKIYWSPAWAWVSKWGYFACLGQGKKWWCLRGQTSRQEVSLFSGQSQSPSYCLFPYLA